MKFSRSTSFFIDCLGFFSNDISQVYLNGMILLQLFSNHLKNTTSVKILNKYIAFKLTTYLIFISEIYLQKSEHDSTIPQRSNLAFTVVVKQNHIQFHNKYFVYHLWSCDNNNIVTDLPRYLKR